MSNIDYSLEDLMSNDELNLLATGLNVNEQDIEIFEEEFGIPKKTDANEDDDDEDIVKPIPASRDKKEQVEEEFDYDSYVDADGLEDEEPTKKDASGENKVSPEVEVIVKGSYKLLQDEGILNVDEDFSFDGTPESLKVALEKTKENLFKEVSSQVWATLPAIIAGKEDQVSIDYDELNLENEGVQKAIVAQDLKLSTSYSDERIRQLVNRTEDMGVLKEEALSAVTRLKEHQEKLREDAIKEAMRIKQESEQLFRQRRENLQKAIKESPNIHGKRKSKLEAFMFNPIRQGDEVSTGYHRIVRQIASNPEHEAELANFLYDYDPEKGFNYQRLAKQDTSKKIDEFQTKLNNAYDIKGKVSGGTTPRTDKFDFSKWHEQFGG